MADENLPQPTEEPPKALNMIESASAAADRLTRENERLEKNLKQLQELEAIKKLGGRTEGKPQEVKVAEETPQDYAKRVLQGNFKK
jgi:hypothetical protein